MADARQHCFAALGLLLAAGCSKAPTITADAALADGGVSTDGGVSADGGLSAGDSGWPPMDAGAPRGFFVMMGDSSSEQDKDELLALPYVDGITSLITWAALEPTQGQYEFGRLDTDIAIAASHGKRVSLVVFTGKNALPAWLPGAGVVTWTNDGGTTLIDPRDDTFITVWTERIRVLGRRYDGNATVAQVGICGATGTLCGPRYPALPAGTSYQDLLDAWRPIIQAYVTAFPRTYKHVEVHLTVGYGADLPVDLFTSIGASALAGPFAEFLSNTNPTATSPPGMAFSQIAAGREWCGFQMVSPLGADVGDAITHGRSFGCQYFEIYPNDLRQQGAIIAPLH